MVSTGVEPATLAYQMYSPMLTEVIEGVDISTTL